MKIRALNWFTLWLLRAGRIMKAFFYLQNLLPFNKRSIENFENHFKAAGLDPIVEYQVKWQEKLSHCNHASWQTLAKIVHINKPRYRVSFSTMHEDLREQKVAVFRNPQIVRISVRECELISWWYTQTCSVLWWRQFCIWWSFHIAHFILIIV